MREQFMRRAIALSIENIQAARGGPFGCVIVRDDRILAEGTNCVTSANDPTAHAEVIAIRNACRKLGSWQLTGCEIYSSCEPCPMCLGAVYWARPSRLYFAGSGADAAAVGFDDLFIYEQLKITPAERSIQMVQILREEALEAFSLWQRMGSKIGY
jgi:guanine deaminase